MTAAGPHLVLVGGGHAHLEVLRRFAEARAAGGGPAVDLSLVSLADRQHYSGMVPGYLAGIYGEDELAIPLAPLAARAGGRFVRAEVVAIDPRARRLALASGEALPYDLVSFDIGSLAAGGDRPDVERHARTVKPIGRAAALRRELRALPARVVVVGGGAAGVEVAFAAARVLGLPRRDRRVTLVEGGDRILAGYAQRVRTKARRLLARRGVEVETGRPVAEVGEGRVVLEGGGEAATDLTVWMTGPAAPPLFAGSGLPLDERGFLLVGPGLAAVGSEGDRRVFGAGDCVTLAHAPDTPKAGVYAVKQGPVLFESLRTALGARATPPVYRPQSGFLSLLNTCDGRALLAWKGWAAHGRWAWWLKDAIDRRFVRKYR